MNQFIRVLFALALPLGAVIIPLSASAAGKLEIRDAWIRSSPPNAMMLAGYATLHNTGATPITISAVKAEGFDDTSLHETVLVGDVSQMRPMSDITIAPSESVAFTPGGKHIMLMQPTKSPKPADRVAITFSFADGGSEAAVFVVRDWPAPPVDHAVDHEH